MEAGLITSVVSLSIALTAVATQSVLSMRQQQTTRSAGLASNLTNTTINLLWECRKTDFLVSEEFILRRLHAEHPSDRGVLGLPFEARNHVMQVGHFYAVLGMLSASKVVPNDLLLGAVHWRVQVVWSALQPYVLAERELHRNRYWSYFEHLARLAADTDKGEVLARQGVHSFGLGVRSAGRSPCCPDCVTLQRMDDKTVLGRINGLVDEEHQLRQQLGRGEITTDDEHTRLKELEEALDQCWDLLRRRRSARELGHDPDAEQARAVNEVEGYLQ